MPTYPIICLLNSFLGPEACFMQCARRLVMMPVSAGAMICTPKLQLFLGEDPPNERVIPTSHTTPMCLWCTSGPLVQCHSTLEKLPWETVTCVYVRSLSADEGSSEIPSVPQGGVDICTVGNKKGMGYWNFSVRVRSAYNGLHQVSTVCPAKVLGTCLVLVRRWWCPSTITCPCHQGDNNCPPCCHHQ